MCVPERDTTEQTTTPNTRAQARLFCQNNPECALALDGMTLQQGHGEASQPAQIVAQRSFAGAAVVLAKVHIQHPVHRLDAPVTADRLAESLAAEITAENVVPRLVRLAAVGVLGDPQRVADRLDPRPFLLEREVGRNLGEKVRPFIDPTVAVSLVS